MRPGPTRPPDSLTLLAAAALCAGLAFNAPAVLAHSEHGGGYRSSKATELVNRSLSMLGVNYKWGGNTPDSGLDCSGLVRYVYGETIGRMLPRRSVEMSRVGEPVRLDKLKPGDLVFFNTLRRAFSHVGIYIGNSEFVHAPSTGGSVRVESLDTRYWAKRFSGARRLLVGEDRQLLAAEDRREPAAGTFRGGSFSSHEQPPAPVPGSDHPAVRDPEAVVDNSFFYLH
jgi:hypothetical protein